MVDTSTEAVTKLLDGVTPGPWRVSKSYRGIVSDSPSGYDDAESVHAYGGHMVCESVMDHNRPFIAAARDLVQALLAERDALKKERDEAIEGWHVIHPNITVQDAAKVDRVACAMWKADADRAAPNVGRNRTPEMFANELDDTRAKWLGLADAALRAITEDNA